ncbi:hypothetical protein D1007_15898 [Hordeum vulgare]|nr:hypothetical protein D1007_15898 [Hordeum vulgare]
MAAAQGEHPPLYKDASAPVEARVRDLLGRMTLQEKAGQMAQVELSVASPRALAELGVGSLLNGGGRPPFDGASPSDWAGVVDSMQRLALSSRLSVPIIYGVDAVHGHNNVIGATIFPHNVGLGASRHVCRDSRWGRCYESYSEDPEIVRSFTTIVAGLQGQTPADHPHGYPFLHSVRENVLACAKHYVGDGGTHNGINEGNTICSLDDLERIHMKPYPDCITQGVATIMASFSQWNGEPLHASHFLLTDVLKGKLGFQGFVVSDWEGIDHLCDPRGSNYRHCIAQAVNAGMDMIMIPFRFETFLEDLVFLVETGEIPLSRIDDAVERILRVKFISGVFEHPFSDPTLLDVIGCKEHRQLAREAVRKSLVLLKNGKNQKEPFLPLAKNAKRILVTGTHADNIGYQCGGWTIAWHGDSGKITPGEVPYAEGLGDRADLSIPFNGSDLITRVARKVPTLVIVISGRPLVIEPQVLEKVDALVVAWLPGSEGMGVTDCLFGDHDFVGTLPVTWFRSDDQLPIDIRGANYDPLFPFGYGLKCSEAMKI